MGSDHHSAVVFGADPTAVRASLVRWMRSKGFPLQDGPPLTALDFEHERGLRLAQRDDRTIVLAERTDEFPRMVQTLLESGAPVLHYWLHDSDFWGYELRSGAQVVSAFQSPARGLGPTAEFGEDAENDVLRLCTELGIPDRVDDLRRLQAKKTLYMETVSSAFCDLLGVPPAAASYDAPRPDVESSCDFESEHLWFRRHDWEPMEGFSVDDLRIHVAEPETTVATYEELQRIGRRAATWIAVVRFVFLPLRLVLRGIWWWRMRTVRRQVELARDDDGRDQTQPVLHAPLRIDGSRLVNDLHRCSIALGDGVEVVSPSSLDSGSAEVFRLRIDRAGPLRCWAMLPAEAQNVARIVPTGAEIEEHRTSADDRAVRLVEVRCSSPGAQGRRQAVSFWRLLAFIVGPRAIFGFSLQGPGELEERVRDRFEAVVTSTRFHV